MTDPTMPPPPDPSMPPPDPSQTPSPDLSQPPPPPYGQPSPPAYGQPANPYGAPMATQAGAVAGAPIGQIRSTGTVILLSFVTLGIYGWVWYYKTHEEMKRHSGEGIGGGIALLLAILVGIVMPFLSSNEVGHLYERRGQKPPVTALTGLWALLLGWFFFVGIIVWIVKTNGALNDYWRSLGAR
jgi:Domain of unknown function (DUF4234)